MLKDFLGLGVPLQACGAVPLSTRELKRRWGDQPWPQARRMPSEISSQQISQLCASVGSASLRGRGLGLELRQEAPPLWRGRRPRDRLGAHGRVPGDIDIDAARSRAAKSSRSAASSG